MSGRVVGRVHGDPARRADLAESARQTGRVSREERALRVGQVFALPRDREPDDLREDRCEDQQHDADGEDDRLGPAAAAIASPPASEPAPPPRPSEELGEQDDRARECGDEPERRELHTRRSGGRDDLPRRDARLEAPARGAAGDGCDGVRVGRGGLKDLPLVTDLHNSFYFKGEGDRSIWVSPLDETPVDPCDAAPEEIDVATAIDRTPRLRPHATS